MATDKASHENRTGYEFIFSFLLFHFMLDFIHRKRRFHRQLSNKNKIKSECAEMNSNGTAAKITN